MTKPKGRILIVDDEEDTREPLAELLAGWGWETGVADGVVSALKLVERRAFDVVLTDLAMPAGGGLELLRCLRADKADMPVLVLSGQGSIHAAVEAMQEGAYDFIEKPYGNGERLKKTLELALKERQRLKGEEVAHRKKVREGTDKFIGESRAMQDVFGLIEKVAPEKASVIVTGQSGTGKEMVARTVHELSTRSSGPFVAINCSAIAPTLMESELFGHERGAFTGASQRRLGCFELADGGTLFLDEIGEIPSELQAKFLRVLEEEKVRRVGGKEETRINVRVLAATNRDLKARIQTGEFREDLYYRLNVFQIHLPALRDRPEDIPALVELFVQRFASDAGKRIPVVSDSALKFLMNYHWPGNIRELRNCIERAVILCDGSKISDEHLPAEVRKLAGVAALHLPLEMKLRDVNRTYIEAVLVRCGGNKTRTAKALGISEKTLYNKLNRYDDDDERDVARLN